MIKVDIDQQELQIILKDKIEQKIKDIDQDLVFWDRKELQRRTCLSWNTIQKTFFYETDFPKYKIGSKWCFPAEETKQFLINWLRKQRRP